MGRPFSKTFHNETKSVLTRSKITTSSTKMLSKINIAQVLDLLCVCHFCSLRTDISDLFRNVSLMGPLFRSNWGLAV